VVEQLANGLDLEPYGVEYLGVEGPLGQQPAQLDVSSPHLLDVLL
jgi:hypothetical protein